MYSFYEFFCGGGMARAGLGRSWECLLANDFDHKKGETYRSNHRGDALIIEDVRKLKLEHFPERPDLVWASFPCQDLSLAGGGAGLKGDRSGTFWPFWEHMKTLAGDGRAPSLIVLENVPGTLTSHRGQDFAAICKALQSGGYRFGALVIDAIHFVPQSRPRLFIVALRGDVAAPPSVLADGPSALWHTKTLRRAYDALPARIAKDWLWWRLPTPTGRRRKFASLIEDRPKSVKWHSPAETRKLLGMMSEVNRAKVEKAKAAGERMVGTIYKRTRRDAAGAKVQRAEVRFDEVAGCLRTPAGGSSRQLIMVVEGERIRSRLLSTREAARLMGLKDSYALPENYNEAYHLAGDGVVVPVVRHLAKHIFEPVITSLRVIEPKKAEAA